MMANSKLIPSKLSNFHTRIWPKPLLLKMEVELKCSAYFFGTGKKVHLREVAPIPKGSFLLCRKLVFTSKPSWHRNLNRRNDGGIGVRPQELRSQQKLLKKLHPPMMLILKKMLMPINTVWKIEEFFAIQDFTWNQLHK